MPAMAWLPAVRTTQASMDREPGAGLEACPTGLAGTGDWEGGAEFDGLAEGASAEERVPVFADVVDGAEGEVVSVALGQMVGEAAGFADFGDAAGVFGAPGGGGDQEQEQKPIHSGGLRWG